jgi:hypothetical protein
MLPGPDQIIACPHCQGLAKYRTWVSGTRFGVLGWTDGKQEDVGMVGPRPPAVVKCRHCAECYWLADAKEIGTVAPWRGEGRPVDPAWRAAPEVEEPAEEEYYRALEKGLAKDRRQEGSVRVLAWWRRNDAFRSRPEPVTAAPEGWRRNLEALARLLDEGDENDLLMKAEVLRELGQFQPAKELLSRVGSSEYRGVARQLRDLCDRGDRCVRQLSFEESQDVDALIAMAKAGGTPRLPAVYALGEIGAAARPAVPVLVELLRDGDVETAFRAADALRKIGNWADRAFPVLVELLKDDRDMIRGMAAKLLGELGPHAEPAIPVLRGALADESCYVRVHAERALQALDPPRRRWSRL